MTPEQEIREALARIISGPPDNGVSHRRALAALGRLVADRDHAHEAGFSEGYTAASRPDAEGAECQ